MDLSKHIAYFRSVDLKNPPVDFGSRFADLLTALQTGTNNTEQQGNLNPAGQPPPPAQIHSLNVQAQNGHFQIAVTDNNPIYRGVQYFVEHSDNPNFTNAHVVHLGDSRNHNLFLGNSTRYFRAYSAYAGSGPSKPVYFGGAQPTAVSGGGSVGAPAFLKSQGSGTGQGANGIQAAQGLQGPGSVPFRSVTGAAPARA